MKLQARFQVQPKVVGEIALNELPRLNTFMTVFNFICHSSCPYPLNTFSYPHIIGFEFIETNRHRERTNPYADIKELACLRNSLSRDIISDD